MVDFYPYLIPSLPMLHFGMKPPFSFEQFLEICHQFIPEQDFQLLRTLPQPKHYSGTRHRHNTIQKWIEFDTALRNELAKVRATRKHTPPALYLRPEWYSDSSLTTVALTATSNPSLLDAEMALDEIRWKALEMLATGHHFDLDSLITYAYKLLILLRWENIRTADPKKLLEHTLMHSRG
ncbi:MAG: hypothetical protein MUC66_02355 [Methanolinea sp.]|jgi:hypothetical protein|nr:hypothetical protein [Methanolinea sp.]